MVPFVRGKKRGKANSEGDFCICMVVTCYMSHRHEIDADFHITLDSISGGIKIIFL